MRIAWKLSLGVTAVLVSLAILNARQRVAREAELFEHDIEHDNRMVGHVLAATARQLEQAGGEAAARDLISSVAPLSAGSARWVWLDAPPGHPDRPTMPEVGVPALAEDRTLLTGEALYCYVRFDLGGRRGAIELAESLDAERDYLTETVKRTVTTTGLQLALAIACVLAMTSLFVGRPVNGLVEQARAIARGDLAPRTRSRSRDEIGQLAQQLDDTALQLAATRAELERATAARIAAIEQLRHADRLVTVGQLGAGIAHELGTPLGVIIGHAQMTMADHPPPSPAYGHAEIVVNQARRATTIIRQLLDFARRREPQRVTTELRDLIERTLAMLAPLAAKRRVTLRLRDGAPCEAAIDAGQIQQAITNLVVNAIDATQDGAVELAVQRDLRAPPKSGLAPRPCVAIAIRDTGTGISPEHLARIFEPFFTTKGPGHGTGLGLSVAHGFATDHGGWLEVESTPGEGTTFVIAIPEAA